MIALKLLAIDTSGKIASAAVSDGELLLAEKYVYTSLTHSQIILPMAKQLLSDCELDFEQLDGIVCAKGPGSYTGLRIGIAAVKGIVLGAPHLKCAGVSTLESLAWNCLAYQGRIISVMYARKDTVYCGVYESDGEKINLICPDKVCSITECAALVGNKAMLTGDYCAELKSGYFDGQPDIKCAPWNNRLQRASSLCPAFEADPNYAVDADELSAAYLQETLAARNKYNSVGGSTLL